MTVSDFEGSVSFNLHQVIKKILLYSVVIILAIIISGFILISTLSSKVDELTFKKVALKSEYSELELKNRLLIENISQKTQELTVIKDKVNSIEELFDLELDNSLTLNERVDLTQVTLKEKRLTLRQIPSIYPLKYKGVTSKFGWREHPVLKRREFHSGIDLRAKMGTDIFATADGIVTYVRDNYDKGYGNMIIISHNYGFKTVYAHLSKILVKKGDVINQRDLIAKSGNSGLSSGPHLHYSIKYVDTHLNPQNFFDWSLSNYKKLFEVEKSINWQPLIAQLSTYSKLVLHP